MTISLGGLSPAGCSARQLPPYPTEGRRGQRVSYSLVEEYSASVKIRCCKLDNEDANLWRISGRILHRALPSVYHGCSTYPPPCQYRIHQQLLFPQICSKYGQLDRLNCPGRGGAPRLQCIPGRFVSSYALCMQIREG